MSVAIPTRDRWDLLSRRAAVTNRRPQDLGLALRFVARALLPTRRTLRPHARADGAPPQWLQLDA